MFHTLYSFPSKFLFHKTNWWYDIGVEQCNTISALRHHGVFVILPIESTIPIAGGHFGCCTVGFVHWFCGPLRFILPPIYIKNKPKTNMFKYGFTKTSKH